MISSGDDEGGGSGTGVSDPNSGLGQVVHSVAHTAGAVYIPPCKCDTGMLKRRKCFLYLIILAGDKAENQLPIKTTCVFVKL